MIDLENVKRKIGKLLQVANAKRIANQAEAEQALRLAQELMIKYAIDEATLSGFDEKTLGIGIIKKEIDVGGKRLMENKFIPSLLIDFFNVRLIWTNREKLTFVGTRTNIEIAENVYWYLRRVFRDLWLDYYYSFPEWDRTTRRKQPYYDGLRLGLRNRLKEERQKNEQMQQVTTALMVSKRALAVRYREMFPRVARGKMNFYRRDDETFSDGMRDSSKINIVRGVVSDRNSAKILPPSKVPRL